MRFRGKEASVRSNEPRIDSQLIVSALDELVKHDGAGLELLDADPDGRTISLRLVLDGVECLECVMPRDYLEQLSLSVLRPKLPELERVVIDDPRESSPVGSGANH
jgi:hypothetical protein